MSRWRVVFWNHLLYKTLSGPFPSVVVLVFPLFWLPLKSPYRDTQTWIKYHSCSCWVPWLPSTSWGQGTTPCILTLFSKIISRLCCQVLCHYKTSLCRSHIMYYNVHRTYTHTQRFVYVNQQNRTSDKKTLFIMNLENESQRQDLYMSVCVMKD